MLIQYIDGIYVCDIKTSLNKMLYEKYDIDIVLNFTTDYPFIDMNIKKCRIPISNILNHHTDIPLIKNNLQKILKYIYEILLPFVDTLNEKLGLDISKESIYNTKLKSGIRTTGHYTEIHTPYTIERVGKLFANEIKAYGYNYGN